MEQQTKQIYFSKNIVTDICRKQFRASVLEWWIKLTKNVITLNEAQKNRTLNSNWNEKQVTETRLV